MTDIEKVPVTKKSILSIMGFQVLFYGVIFVLVYWLATLNVKWLVLSSIVTLLQYRVKESNRSYINFVLDYLKPQ